MCLGESSLLTLLRGAFEGKGRCLGELSLLTLLRGAFEGKGRCSVELCCGYTRWILLWAHLWAPWHGGVLCAWRDYLHHISPTHVCGPSPLSRTSPSPAP
eukprot:scaffold8836_cov109-Isochrysis_galbana.AAC.3